MNPLNERENGNEGVESAGSPVAEVCSPRHLLQQLNQVQEELEQYYLKCLDLDSELQVARLAGDDAKREIQALRAQLQHMQEELQQAADRTARGKARRLLSRFGLRRLMRRVRRNGERHDLRAQLEAIRSSRWFDAAWYLDAYPDVRDAGMDPAGHYIEFGWKDARNPGPLFDTAWCLVARVGRRWVLRSGMVDGERHDRRAHL